MYPAGARSQKATPLQAAEPMNASDGLPRGCSGTHMCKGFSTAKPAAVQEVVQQHGQPGMPHAVTAAATAASKQRADTGQHVRVRVLQGGAVVCQAGLLLQLLQEVVQKQVSVNCPRTAL